VQLAVLAHYEHCPAPRHATQQTQGAEVPILDPQLVRLNALAHLQNHTPLLGMALLARYHIGAQHPLLLQDHQRLPRQGGGPGAAQGVQAMFCRREMIAIEPLALLARPPRG
jgi:hypothetical protein